MNPFNEIATSLLVNDADHDADLVLWCDRQAQLLRDGHLPEIDVAHLIEELDDMSASHRRKLQGHLTLLMLNLLACQHQPHPPSAQVVGALDEQRHQIALLLAQSPSLGDELAHHVDAAYPVALLRATQELLLPASGLPATNPFPLTQLRDPGFFP